MLKKKHPWPRYIKRIRYIDNEGRRVTNFVVRLWAKPFGRWLNG